MDFLTREDFDYESKISEQKEIAPRSEGYILALYESNEKQYIIINTINPMLKLAFFREYYGVSLYLCIPVLSHLLTSIKLKIGRIGLKTLIALTSVIYSKKSKLITDLCCRLITNNKLLSNYYQFTAKSVNNALTTSLRFSLKINNQTALTSSMCIKGISNLLAMEETILK